MGKPSQPQCFQNATSLSRHMWVSKAHGGKCLITMLQKAQPRQYIHNNTKSNPLLMCLHTVCDEVPGVSTKVITHLCHCTRPRHCKSISSWPAWANLVSLNASRTQQASAVICEAKPMEANASSPCFRRLSPGSTSATTQNPTPFSYVSTPSVMKSLESLRKSSHISAIALGHDIASLSLPGPRGQT